MRHQYCLQRMLRRKTARRKPIVSLLQTSSWRIIILQQLHFLWGNAGVHTSWSIKKIFNNPVPQWPGNSGAEGPAAPPTLANFNITPMALYREKRVESCIKLFKILCTREHWTYNFNIRHRVFCWLTRESLLSVFPSLRCRHYALGTADIKNGRLKGSL